MNKIIIMLIVLSTTIALTGSVIGDSYAFPQGLGRQGLIKYQGTPYNGNISTNLSTYAVASGGTSSWIEKQVVTTKNGTYNIFYGTTTPLPIDVLLGFPYIQFDINGETLSQRYSLNYSTSAYARVCEYSINGTWNPTVKELANNISSNNESTKIYIDQKSENASQGKGNTSVEIRRQFYGSDNTTVNSNGTIFSKDTTNTYYGSQNTTVLANKSIISKYEKNTDSNYSTSCASGEYGDGAGTCINFNDTVASITATINNVPNFVNVTSGTVDSGNLTSIQTIKDSDSLNISEASGANPLVVIINFTGVLDINNIVLRTWYSDGSGHTLAIGLFDYTTGLYEEEYGFISDQSGFETVVIDVSDAASHINNTNASLRLRHVQNGITSHDLFIDYAELTDGFTTTTTHDHDALSGRGDIETNHPGAASQSTVDSLNESVINETDGNLTITNRRLSIFSENMTTWIRTLFYGSDNLTVNTNGTIFSKDTDTTYTAGSNMTLSGTEFSCKYEANTDTTYTGSGNVTLSGTDFDSKDTTLTATEVETIVEAITELVMARINITNGLTIQDDKYDCVGDQNDYCRWFDSNTGTMKEGTIS